MQLVFLILLICKILELVFEAWCLIIKAKTSNPGLEIELDVKNITEADYDGKLPENGHLGRFLYRILKFSEQYKLWFKLSPILDNLKDKFKTYLDSHIRN